MPELEHSLQGVNFIRVIFCSNCDKHPSPGISSFLLVYAFAHRHKFGIKDEQMLLALYGSFQGGVPEDGACVEAHPEGPLRLTWWRLY